MGKAVVSTYNQLRGAFKAHGNVSEQSTSPSCRLLQFYAVECGLKAVYLKDNRLPDTSHLEASTGKKYGDGHDLIKWVGRLKRPRFSIKCPSDTNKPIARVHEKLRYGVTCNEHKLFINTLYSTLKKELSGNR